MKKALSLILALALAISLVPLNISAVETGATKTFEFSKVSSGAGSVGSLKEDDGGKFIGIDYLTEKSTTYTTTATQRLEWGKLIMVATEKTLWKNASDNASQLVFTADLGTDASAGWYQIAFTGGNWYPSADLYIYANDTYVGNYIPKKNVGAYEIGDKKTYGAVYLEPDANGKVEFKIALAGLGAASADGTGQYWEGRILLNSLSLTYLGAKDEYGYKMAHTIPAEIDYKADADGIEFTAYADAGDGIARAMNGIKSDRSTEGADSFSVEIVDGDSVTLEKTITGGVCTGKLVPKGLGDTTIRLTATINGQTYMDTKTISVTSNEPMPVAVDFTKTEIKSGNTAADLKVEGQYAAVREKTGTYETDNYTKMISEGTDKILQVCIRRDNSHPVWVNAGDTKTNAQFTIKVPVAVAGYYNIELSGYEYMTQGSDYYVYANNKYAGFVSFYGNDKKTAFSKQLNTLYLAPDDDKTVEIMFCVARNQTPYWINLLYLKTITLTPVENLEKVEFGSFAETLPEEIAVGETVDFTVSAMMNDGSLRRINGYTSAATADAGNYTAVSVKSGNATITKTSDDKFSDGVFAGTLTASAPGNVVLTMTSCIDGGTPVTEDITVTVPSPDVDAEHIDNTISYIVRAQDSANNEKIAVSDEKYTVNGTNVGEWTVGESFTATANGDDFAYWANGSGAPVSTEASYTFNPTSNFTLEAVYTPADATTKTVQFWNYNKVYLGDKDVTADNKVESMPVNPTLNGWNFDKWTTDGEDTFDASTIITDVITRVVAQFTKNAAGFNVGGEIKAYDDTYTDTAADEKDGTAFSYWTIDGQVASYNKTLSFNVWDTVNVVPVYAGTKTAVPTVALDKVSNEEYFILYEVPAGYTAVDAGIVFGNNEPRVDSTDGSKASVKKAGAKGQFTAAPHEGAAETVKARGYVMYTDDATGALRILYTTAQ